MARRPAGARHGHQEREELTRGLPESPILKTEFKKGGWRMTIGIILKVERGKMMLRYQDGHQPCVVGSTVAFYGVTLYGRGSLREFLCF